MSDQMTTPVSNITNYVMIVGEYADELTEEETESVADEIQKQGAKITDLLNQLITESEKIK